MEIESGYPSESDAQASKYSGRNTTAATGNNAGNGGMDDSLNESKISIMPPIIKVRAEQD